MSVYFALCHGAELRVCTSCQRHVDHHPAAAADPYQPFTAPQTSGERCLRWMPRPAAPLNPPRVDTGD